MVKRPDVIELLERHLLHIFHALLNDELQLGIFLHAGNSGTVGGAIAAEGSLVGHYFCTVGLNSNDPLVGRNS